MKRESSGNKSGRPRSNSSEPRKSSSPRGGSAPTNRRTNSSGGAAPYRKSNSGGDFFKKDSTRKPYASISSEDKPYDRKPRTGGDFKAGATRKPYASRSSEDKPYDRKPRTGGDFKAGATRKPYASRSSEDKPYDRKPRTGGDFKAGATRKPYASRSSEDKPYDRKPRTGEDYKTSATRKPYASRSSEDKPYDRKPRTGGDFKAGATRKPYASRSSEDKPYDRKPRTEGAYNADRPKRPYKKSADAKSFEKDGRRPYTEKRGDKTTYSDKSKKAYGGADSFKERKSIGSIRENKVEDSSTHNERIGDNSEFPARPSRKRNEFSSSDPGKGKFTKKSELKGFRPKFDKDAPKEDFRFAKPGARGKKIDLGLEEEFVSTSKSQAKERATEQALKVGESIRLNRFISNAGVCSRREADELIGAGLVSINSEVVTELGSKVKAGDVVRFNGEKLTVEAKVYILLNKPKDAITTSDDPDGRNTVMDIFDGKLRERIFPIGRLDRNTTGVLLLTNDGELANRLMHPKYEIKKVYKATLDKNLKPADLWTLSNGVELEDGFSKPDALANSDAKNKNVVGIEIHSGKNRIIHRMFEHLGYSVEKLDRVLYAGIEKGVLKRGTWRELNEKELKNLKKSVQMK
jgi:23S rRNA pseudouridine2605 synthase